MASSPDLLPDYHDNPAELVDRLKKISTGKVEPRYPFVPRDWRPDAIPLLMYQAGCLIEWLYKHGDKNGGYHEG